MKTSATRLFRQAVRSATASVKTIAEEAGYSRVSLDKYLRERPPSDAVVLAVADALEKRAAKLADYGKRLRAAGERRPVPKAKARSRPGAAPKRRRAG